MFRPLAMYILGIPGHVILGYADCVVELGVLIYLLARVLRGHAHGLLGVTAYMLASVGVGGLRVYSAFHWGAQSRQYALCYWLTDCAVVFAVFLLIASFFRRACAEQAKSSWRYVRLMLLLVFVLTGGVAYISIVRHHATLFPFFVIEFDQDIYFVCLVLATLLYLLLQQLRSADDQLGLLVSGLGLGVSAYVASLALFYVSGRALPYGVLTGYVSPLCDIGMVAVWFYAAARVPKPVSATEARRAREVMPVQALARI